MSADHLTAAELGIRTWEHQALQGIRVLLLAGRIRVDMRQPDLRLACGSAVCVGGWVAAMSPQAPDQYVLTYEGPLVRLYFPPQQAAYSAGSGAVAAAIDAFLCGAAEDPWGAALRRVRWFEPGERV